VKPRVVLADDHVLVAEGLARLLAESTELVACVSDGRELVEAVERLRPDVVVTDVAMPRMGGLEAMRELKGRGSKARFVFLTAHVNARVAAEALRDGAAAYLLKHSAGEELEEALRAVTRGRTYLTPLLAGDVLVALSNHPGAAEPRLSARQLEVLRLLADGKRLKEIAAELGLSVRTVEDHKAALMREIGVDSTAGLVRFAVRQGLVQD
jgi:DNA-binding NarL/FixJ family response regulator